MNFWRALAMPLQPTSLLFVGATSVLLLPFRPGETVSPIALLGTYVLTSWANKYAFALLDAAGNGRTEAPVASVEMLGPFGDWRAWVHPLLATGLGLLAWYLTPAWPAAVILAAALLLWPASLVTLAITHHAGEALNPLALMHSIRALGVAYLGLLAALGLACGGIWVLAVFAHSDLLRNAGIQLLLFGWYALVGGIIHDRRLPLDFEPHVSPERRAQAQESTRQRERQAMLDLVYAATNLREDDRARELLRQWFATHADDLPRDLPAIAQQAGTWALARSCAVVQRVLVSTALQARQPALALVGAEAGLARLPQFAAATAEETLTLARYARHSGRPRLARSLLENFSRQAPDQPLGAEARALLDSLPQ